jgi:hypothetical protein
VGHFEPGFNPACLSAALRKRCFGVALGGNGGLEHDGQLEGSGELEGSGKVDLGFQVA